MDSTPATHPCYAMSDRELVATLTLERAQFHEPFLAVAEQELARRGLALDSFIDQVEVGANAAERSSGTIAQALEVLQRQMPLWDLRVFANCLGQVLAMQREYQCWSVHYYQDDEYGGSFFVALGPPASELLGAFLRLQEWIDLAGEGIDLQRWKNLIQSPNRHYVEQVAAGLDEQAVPHTVQTPLFSGADSDLLTVLVPSRGFRQARQVIAQLGDELDALYNRAEQLHQEGALEEEDKLYERLVQLAPNNPAVFYNRGSILLELGRFEAAADALIEAVALGLPELSKSVAPRRTGGLGGQLGLFMTLFKRLLPTRGDDASTPSEYPDFIDDVELHLQELVEKVPQPLRSLHCLAAIARLKNDEERVGQLYQRILTLDPQDRVARFNLGYLHAAGEED